MITHNDLVNAGAPSLNDLEHDGLRYEVTEGDGRTPVVTLAIVNPNASHRERMFGLSVLAVEHLPLRGLVEGRSGTPLIQILAGIASEVKEKIAIEHRLELAA